VAASDCPSAKTISGLVGRAVQAAGDQAVTAADGVNCDYNSINLETGIWAFNVNVDSTDGANSYDTYYPNLGAARLGVEKSCGTIGCILTTAPSYGPGSFEVYGESKSIYGGGVTTGECDIWIRDQENHPVDVSVQVNSLKGATADMSRTITCGEAKAVTQLLMG